MKAIVAVDLNWGIGYKGSLLQRIPEDQKFFKGMTIGKVVVMGRETFESLPGKLPLKDRTNIVLSKSRSFENKDIIVCRSLDELFIGLKNYDSEEVFAIGGEAIYTQLLPYCTEAYVTKILRTHTADRYFVNLDEENDWELAYEGELKNHKDVEYKFVKYVRKQ